MKLLDFCFLLFRMSSDKTATAARCKSAILKNCIFLCSARKLHQKYSPGSEISSEMRQIMIKRGKQFVLVALFGILFVYSQPERDPSHPTNCFRSALQVWNPVKMHSSEMSRIMIHSTTSKSKHLLRFFGVVSIFL